MTDSSVIVTLRFPLVFLAMLGELFLLGVIDGDVVCVVGQGNHVFLAARVLGGESIKSEVVGLTIFFLVFAAFVFLATATAFDFITFLASIESMSSFFFWLILFSACFTAVLFLTFLVLVAPAPYTLQPWSDSRASGSDEDNSTDGSTASVV